ncbi:MAG: hypothetical protein KA436_08630 [Oligoflexales bacterium]|nr:hypothetical protein [Oligoflexales bacterium]
MDDIKIYSPYVNTQPELILELAKSQVMSQLGVYEEQLVTNSYVYPTLFKNIQGMSGTVWNKESYPSFYQQDYLSNTQEKTLWLLWKDKREKVKIFNFSETASLQQKVDALLEGYPASSIIDQGGVLKGYDHAQIVQHVLGHQSFRDSGLQQMIFYDKNHYLKVYNSEKNEISPWVDFKINRLHTAAFWDLQHTTGSDLRVHPQTHAIVTLSRHSNLRDVLQAVWRLRELHVNQKVSFALLEEDKRLILQTLAKDFHIVRDSLDLNDLLLYLAAHEAVNLSKLTHKSLRNAMKSELIKLSFDRLVDKKKSVTSAHKFFTTVKSLFVEQRPGEAYLRYGHPQVEADAAQALQQDALNISNSSILESFDNKEELKSKIQSIARDGVRIVRKHLPFSFGSQREEAEGEMEVEAEKEQEQADEEEQEDQVEAFTLDPHAQPFERIDWNKNLFLSGYYFDQSLVDRDLRNLFRDKKQDLPPLIALDKSFTAMQEEGLLSLFDDRFSASLNLFPVFSSLEKNEHKHFAFFKEYQKDINDLLFILDLNGHITKCVLIDREEALQFGDWLLSHDLKKHVVLMYKFGLGIVRSSKNVSQMAIDQEKKRELFSRWTQSGDFRMLLVQAKFLSARLTYDEEEKVILKDWIEKFGKEKMHGIFTKRILKKKAASQKEFEGSAIEQVFKELDL